MQMKNIEILGAPIAILAIIAFLLNIVMALAVNGDAKRLLKARGGLFLFGPFVWGLLVFVFGIAGLAVYWGIHHSSLRSPIPPQER